MIIKNMFSKPIDRDIKGVITTTGLAGGLL